MKKVFYLDVETTGTAHWLHDIIQLAYIIEIDGKVVERYSTYVKPFRPENTDPKALEITGIKAEDFDKFPDPEDVYKDLIAVMSKYVNRHDKNDKNDKFYPAGYNVKFDVKFMQNFFKLNDDKYYGSWFNWKLLDVLSMIYVGDYMGEFELANHKLVTVCEYYGIELKAHDAMSDIQATYTLFKKLIGGSK